MPLVLPHQPLHLLDTRSWRHHARLTLVLLVPPHPALQGTMGISGIDTRDLTIALRDVGCLVGVMSTDMSKTDEVCMCVCVRVSTSAPALCKASCHA